MGIKQGQQPVGAPLAADAFGEILSQRVPTSLGTSAPMRSRYTPEWMTWASEVTSA